LGRRTLAAGGMAALLVAALTAAPSVAAAPTFVRSIGDHGHALLYPSGLDVDGAGNVYVADTGNDQVMMFAPGASTPSWRKGSRGASYAAGNFSNPRDIAVGAAHLWVADTDHYLVQVLGLDGSYQGKLNYKFRSPIGVSTGVDANGNEIVLVADGGSGNIEIFSPAGSHLRTIPPRLGSTAGSRDAATDAVGRIYVADYRHDRVQVYDPNGNWLRSWGGAGSPTCQLIPRPYGVDVDAAGRIYVASSNKNQVKVFTTDGTCVKTIGRYGTTNTTLSQLRRVAVGAGADPLVYAADLWGIKISVYRQDNTIARTIGGRPYPAAGGLNEVRDVAVSSAGVYVADTINQRAQRFDLDGSDPIDWGNKGVSSGSFNWPQGIVVNPANGHVWVLDTRNNRLQEFNADGSGPVRTFGSGGATAGKFNWPMDGVFGPDGTFYVADTFNNRIQALRADLTVRWTYGTLGTGVGNLRRPYGVAFDPVGHRLLVADTNNNRIVALDPATGARLAILPIARGSAAGQVSLPQGVAVAADGSIWIADTGNNRVEHFTASGAYAGDTIGGTAPGSGNGAFNLPTAVAFGPGGLLYVADAYNDRVQVFQP
jgi:DNA-binding beta-propeller fold protein YncE